MLTVIPNSWLGALSFSLNRQRTVALALITLHARDVSWVSKFSGLWLSALRTKAMVPSLRSWYTKQRLLSLVSFFFFFFPITGFCVLTLIKVIPPELSVRIFD